LPDQDGDPGYGQFIQYTVRQESLDGLPAVDINTAEVHLPEFTLQLDRGVVLSFAHSNCNYEEAMQAFANGLSVSTHTGNVMSGIHHRNMGGLGACLLNEKVYCEIICDGLHISPVMLELMFRVKERNHWFMISDSSEAAGAPEGTYQFGQLKVIVDSHGFCKTDTGRLMGSTKSVLFGISVLADRLHIPLEEILRMSSLNAARF
jgi:N-acetylglucosamine-6-phosphate deacetylase